jgi:predicted outer membrane repeat protein
MNDGTEYVINVTDAYESPEIWGGGGAYEAGTEFDTGSRHNDVVTWHPDGDGELNTQSEHWAKSGDLAWNDGYIGPKNTVWISGSGDFTIWLDPHPSYDHLTTNYVQLQQIRAGHGVNLKVAVHSNFDSTSVTKIHLTCTGTSNLFIIEEGASLELAGTSHTELVLDGWNDELNAANSHITSGFGLTPPTATTSMDSQLVRLEAGARNFKATYVRFQDAPMSAIKMRPTNAGGNMTTFEMYHCTFDSDNRRNNLFQDGDTTKKATGNGGAIYLESAHNSSYSIVQNFILNDVTFDGCWAAENGGALALCGIIGHLQITGCTFNGRTDGNKNARRGSGGAMYVTGHISKITLQNTSFNNCTATDNGGAIYVGSRKLASSTWSRTNELYITNCQF